MKQIRAADYVQSGPVSVAPTSGQGSPSRLAKVLVLASFAIGCSEAAWWSPTDAKMTDAVAPVQGSFWAATSYASDHEDATPPGSNRWDCKLSAKHPRPVVLVHGTWVDQYQSFASLAPRLAEEGYCVFSLNLGRTVDAEFPMAKLYGTNDIHESAKELAGFVGQVKEKSGAGQVDLVGWSQGGIIIRTYLKYQGGANLKNPARNEVKRVVTLGSPHRGTTLSGLASLVAWGGLLDVFPEYIGPAGPQLVEGSPFLAKLNQGGETFAGIEYTSIYSPFDEIVNPSENARLEAVPGAVVHNIDVHEACDVDFSTHEALPYAKRSLALTLQALDPQGQHHVPCELQIASVH